MNFLKPDISGNLLQAFFCRGEKKNFSLDETVGLATWHGVISHRDFPIIATRPSAFDEMEICEPNNNLRRANIRIDFGNRVQLCATLFTTRAENADARHSQVSFRILIFARRLIQSNKKEISKRKKKIIIKRELHSTEPNR
ncbi:hypothetical protein PUN28_013738 [Cardiocondyla obscurior]|uniref:Uncharacterized protein n=1 Tax=Cardiocondyla obscurior TaxID=286306 RepID=A0AAW2F6W2_9HYME